MQPSFRSPVVSCAAKVAAKSPETRRNPPAAPTTPSHSHARTSLITYTCARHAGSNKHQTQTGGEVGKSRVVAIATYPPAVAPPCPWRRRTPPARDARQDGQDGRGDGADEHRSRGATHRRMARQRIRLKIRGRSPADVAQLLLPQHLVLHRRDLDHLEKTPATTPLAASLSALACAPTANTRRAREGGCTCILEAQTPDSTTHCARIGWRAGAAHRPAG